MSINTTPTISPLFPTAVETRSYLPLKSNYSDHLGKNISIPGHAMWFSRTKQAEKRTDVYYGKTEIIHFVRPDAIKLVVVNYRKTLSLKRIELRPGLLLYNDRDYQPSEQDTAMAMSLAMDLISPLLEHQSQLPHVFPSPAQSVKRVGWMDFACWESMEYVMLLRGASLTCIDKLSLPYSRGLLRTPTCLQLGSSKNKCELQFKRVNIKASEGLKTGTSSLLVRLKISKFVLDDYLRLAGYVKERDSCHIHSVIGVGHIDAGQFLKQPLARLKGSYIPVPQEMPGENEVTKLARLIVLATLLTKAERPKIMAIGQEMYASSKVRRTELKKAVAVERSRLRPIPVVELFTPEVFSAHATGRPRDFDWPIHPLIAALLDSSAGSAVA